MGQIEKLAGYGYVTQFKLPADSLDPKLLDRYLAGECDDQETAAIERALVDNPDIRLAFDTFLQKLNIEVGEPSALETLKSLDRMHAKIRKSGDTPKSRWQGHMVTRSKLVGDTTVPYRTYQLRPLDVVKTISAIPPAEA